MTAVGTVDLATATAAVLAELMRPRGREARAPVRRPTPTPPIASGFAGLPHRH